MKKTSLSLDSTVVAGRDQVSTALPGEVILLQLKQGTYFGLNGEVGAKVWELLKEPRRVSQIRDSLLDEFKVEPRRCEKDLVALLKELLREGLAEIRNGKDS